MDWSRVSMQSFIIQQAEIKWRNKYIKNYTMDEPYKTKTLAMFFYLHIKQTHAVKQYDPVTVKPFSN